MKDIDELKRETDAELRRAREKREERQSRERRDGSIMAAFDRMADGQAVEYTPGPRHAPRLIVVSEPAIDEVDETGEAGA